MRDVSGALSSAEAARVCSAKAGAQTADPICLRVAFVFPSSEHEAVQLRDHNLGMTPQVLGHVFMGCSCLFGPTLQDTQRGGRKAGGG